MLRWSTIAVLVFVCVFNSCSLGYSRLSQNIIVSSGCSALILFAISNAFPHNQSQFLLLGNKKKLQLLLQFAIIHLLIITPLQNVAYMWCKPDLGSDLWTTWLNISPLPCSLLLPTFCPSPHLSIYHPHGQRKSINPPSSHPSLVWTARKKEGLESRTGENLGLLSHNIALKLYHSARAYDTGPCLHLLHHYFRQSSQDSLAAHVCV